MDGQKTSLSCLLNVAVDLLATDSELVDADDSVAS